MIKATIQNSPYCTEITFSCTETELSKKFGEIGMNPEHLYIEECFANKATTMKRIRPRARGMAYRIEKRMSHITVILNERS